MKTYTIATVVKVEHTWFERMRVGVQKFSQDTGHNTFLVGPAKAEEKLQVKMIEDILARGVDALCLVPLFPEALEWTLGQARKKGIAVISHEASDLRNVDYEIEAFDNTAYGAHLMDHLAKYMGGEGQYSIFMGHLMAKSHAEWSAAAIKRQKAQYPKMILATRKMEDLDDPSLAYKKAQEIFATHPKIKGFLGFGMTATMGIGQAIETQKLQDKIALVGVGLVSVCRRQLLNGAIKLISVWDPADAGYVMNKLAVMVLEGKSVTDGMDLGVRGYNAVKMTGKLLVGSAMLDVTKDNMTAYNF
jgi:simple sugar transport system substrate-binding protein